MNNNNNDIAINFENMTFQYETQSNPTLKNINLKIYRGEKVAIVGPSGSGKSTLGHCINGLAPYFYKGQITGRLEIFGENLNGIFEHSKYVGTVLQDSDAQFVGLSVAEDIAFSLENSCEEAKEMHKQVSEIAKFVKIDELLNMKPHNLSGGQKQKVSLAGIMVEDTNIVLYDEPLASLDPLSGKYAIELIDELHYEKSLTSIIIEHRLEDVLHRKLDRVIVMDKGEIIANDTPDNILRSSILKDINIREPLYISALKYSGFDLNQLENISDIRKIDFSIAKNEIVNWIETEHTYNKQEYKEVILEINDVNFSYNENKQILKNISFNVKKGEMVSIVGSNGAGKSTMSKIIAGFEKLEDGSILYEGSDITNESITDRANKIGFVLQNPNSMISKINIFDEVALGLRMRNTSEEDVEKRVNHILEICKLKEYRKWPIKALSYGQKKRVTIASILVLDPKIIILDEPTAGQDLFHYREIMEFLKQLHNYGITIIFITHDMHLMLEYTDRAYVFNNGRLISEGNPEKIFANKEILKEANLKETSLHIMAENLELDSQKLIKKFIYCEKEGK